MSSLFVSGQMTREDALKEMNRKPYSETQLLENKEFVAKKLGITNEELERIFQLPIKTYQDFPSNEWMFKVKDKLVQLPLIRLCRKIRVQ